MKICMVGYTRYEFDSRLHRYAQSLIERGDSVDVICLGTKGQPYTSTMNRTRIYRIQTRIYNETSTMVYLIRLVRFFFLSLIACTRLHVKNRYDLIHYHNVPDFGVFCTILPKLMGAKIILDIHDVVPEFYMRKFNVHESHIIIVLLKNIEKLSAMYADHVITVTDLWRKTLIDRSTDASKCSTIMNLPDTSLFKKVPCPKKQDSKSFLINYHGALTETTGVDVIIRAINRVKESIPDVKFQIIGGGRQLKNLNALVERYDLQNFVIFKNIIPLESIPALIRCADIAIDPKLDGIYAGETLSVKVMEYMQLGIPSIVSNTKAAKMYFTNGCVLFFKPGDDEDLAKCIMELYHSPGKRKNIIENAKKFTAQYNWEKYKKNYYDLIDQLCPK